MTHFIPTRRDLLLSGLAGATLALPSPASAQEAPARYIGKKLCVIILRGAMDGLAAIAPLGDSRYHSLRGSLALDEGHDIGDGFSLHPNLGHVASLWRNGDALGLHACSTAYRDRSHFDGQDQLEAGSPSQRDGWLNRALSVIGPSAETGVGIGQSVPLILRGDAAVSTWAPSVLPDADDDTLTRLIDLYADDARLGMSLQRALQTDEIAGAMGGEMVSGMAGRRRRGAQSWGVIAQAAGELMAAPGGPDLTVIGLDGWDTHVGQGSMTGQLANLFTGLDGVIETLHTSLQQKWSESAIIVCTEFGRTVRVNGAAGTDHGTASAAFLIGGAVNGGRLVGNWPGLSRLHDDRDLMPVNDLNALFKGVLHGHWRIAPDDLDQLVFPHARPNTLLDGLLV